MQIVSLSSVAVYNKKLAVFEKGELLAGKKKYSIIKLNSEDYPESKTKQEMLDFLATFRANALDWKVTSKDLATLYKKME